MASSTQNFLWTEISQAPEEPGIYAWYYRTEITDYDLEEIVSRVEATKDEGEASDLVRAFLTERIFNLFREDPYFAKISGPLKPKYSGFLDHEVNVSQGLIQRIAQNPSKLRGIRDLLDQSAPLFASPLYIGMATKSLRTRLKRHKKLIEYYRAEPSKDLNGEDRDVSFAKEIATRKIFPGRLMAYTMVTSEHGTLANDLENILNRICHPILGKN
jgi:hypothetical protein